MKVNKEVCNALCWHWSDTRLGTDGKPAGNCMGTKWLSSHGAMG